MVWKYDGVVIYVLAVKLLGIRNDFVCNKWLGIFAWLQEH
jgi:hypothetical protein